MAPYLREGGKPAAPSCKDVAFTWVISPKAVSGQCPDSRRFARGEGQNRRAGSPSGPPWMSVGGNRRSPRRSTAPALGGIYDRHNRRL
jgi:hypothetical protein